MHVILEKAFCFCDLHWRTSPELFIIYNPSTFIIYFSMHLKLKHPTSRTYSVTSNCFHAGLQQQQQQQKTSNTPPFPSFPISYLLLWTDLPNTVSSVCIAMLDCLISTHGLAAFPAGYIKVIDWLSLELEVSSHNQSTCKHHQIHNSVQPFHFSSDSPLNLCPCIKCQLYSHSTSACMAAC